jgi:hypothetical protein
MFVIYINIYIHIHIFTEDFLDKESQSKNSDSDTFDREKGAKDQDSESATLLNEVRMYKRLFICIYI